jgi:hypothetical protein
VDDEATGTLMTGFYTHLLEGTGKAEALQIAQSKVRTDPDHPEWAHPYYWAAFVLNGDPGTVVSAASPATAPSSTATTVPAAGKEGRPWLWTIPFLAVLLLGLAFLALKKVRGDPPSLRKGP